jgi:hypothetical protein
MDRETWATEEELEMMRVSSTFPDTNLERDILHGKMQNREKLNFTKNRKTGFCICGSVFLDR